MRVDPQAFILKKKCRVGLQRRKLKDSPALPSSGRLGELQYFDKLTKMPKLGTEMYATLISGPSYALLIIARAKQ